MFPIMTVHFVKSSVVENTVPISATLTNVGLIHHIKIVSPLSLCSKEAATIQRERILCLVFKEKNQIVIA